MSAYRDERRPAAPMKLRWRRPWWRRLLCRIGWHRSTVTTERRDVVGYCVCGAELVCVAKHWLEYEHRPAWRRAGYSEERSWWETT